MISKEAENLLFEIIEHESDGNHWAERFEAADHREDTILRGCFKELKDNQLVDTKWADNIPYIITVLKDGYLYVIINRFSNMMQPQINRAIVQVAKLLPQLESNENAVREVYAQILKSREKLVGSEYADFYGDELDEVLSGSLSWMERITKLKVGRDGYVFVVSKSDGTVLAHPVDEIVGNRVLTDAQLMTGKAEMGEENIENQTDNFADIDIEDLAPDTAPENLDINYRVFIPYSEKGIPGLDTISNLTVGSIASYKDTYIL